MSTPSNPYSKKFLAFMEGKDEETIYRLKERHGIHVDSHCTQDMAEARTIAEAEDQSPVSEALL